VTLSALIRKRGAGKLATAISAISATRQGEAAGAVARIATVAVANPTEEQTTTASRWWLIHFLDGAPLEVACFPPATWAEILERHPYAIAAEPIIQAAPEAVRACSTCTHATYRGACGEPVAAGLSDVVGVIFYHPDQGATCLAWLATLPDNLEVCIRATAERWGYSGDDLAAALDGARVDPAGWWRVVAADEAFEERAAIMEYDGGLSRDEAERQAAGIVGRIAP